MNESEVLRLDWPVTPLEGGILFTCVLLQYHLYHHSTLTCGAGRWMAYKGGEAQREELSYSTISFYQLRRGTGEDKA